MNVKNLNSQVSLPSQNEAHFSLEHAEVVEALEDYQAAFEAKDRPNRREILDRFPAIAEQLEECLQAIEMLHQSASAAKSPAVDPAAAGRIDPSTAQPLGDFQILREIGRGGMGVVYEAQQLSLGRRVALKVLPFAATLDPRQLQRFKNEAQAAACLHHPHIVPVYAVGQERGVHFYAMQYIEGRSLADSIDELRAETQDQADSAVSARPATEPSTETPSFLATERSHRRPQYLRTIARLGLQAAEALDHAHEFGVVHRDIKPGNLLLDRQGELWITDFGLARLESNLDLTMSGDLVGTLRYMSPEQALGKRGVVDHRTDIYSLGATLYELIALQPVFDGADRHELLQQISGQEPRSLRSVNKLVPADLETIVHKCLAKAPDERFATARELGEDLRRFLSDRPIHARRPSLALRVSKWMRRHRTLVASAVGLLALAAVGLAVSNWLIWREQTKTRRAYEAEAQQRRKLLAEQAKTRLAYQAETRQRRQAEKYFLQARQILDYFTQITDEELAEFPGAQQVRRKMLQASLEYYKTFLRQAENNRSLQKEMSDSHFHVAAILAEMGRKRQSLAAIEKAAIFTERLVLRNPADANLRKDLTAVYQSWGMMKSGGVIRFVGQQSVQRDLQLSKRQTQQIDAIVAEQRSFFWKKRGRFLHGRDQLMKEFDKLTRTATEKIAGLLSEEQIRRLKQITLQESGAYAFKNRDIVARLRLTQDQQAAIQKILDARRRSASVSASRATFKSPFSRKNRVKNRKNPDDRSDIAAIEKLLTGEQKASWRQIIGPRFEGRIRRFPHHWARGFRGRRGFPPFSFKP